MTVTETHISSADMTNRRILLIDNTDAIVINTKSNEVTRKVDLSVEGYADINQVINILPKPAASAMTFYGPFPRRTIAYAERGKYKIFTLEYPPSQVSINVRDTDYEILNPEESDPTKIRYTGLMDEVKSYHISLPFIQTIIAGYVNANEFVITKTRILCSKESITNGGGLYRLPLPNLYGDGTVCWGRSPIRAAGINHKLESVLPHFIQEESNRDLSVYYPRELDLSPEERSPYLALSYAYDIDVHRNLHARYRKWAELTKQNHMCSLGFTYELLYNNLQNAVGDMV